MVTAPGDCARGLRCGGGGKDRQMAELICAGKEDGLKGESEDEDERSAGI
jgi:hypothetical protein